ncbi:MAG: hypothetical protein Q7K45_00570, partial [Nanoarchaeota archaeon]|nr:hypothetical protein [Nanoarchaeota archaeon]
MSLIRVSKTIDDLVPKQDQVSGVMVWYGQHRTKMSYVCGSTGPSPVWGFCAVEYPSHNLSEMEHESVFGKSVECMFSNYDDYHDDSALKSIAHLYKKNSWVCGLPSPDHFSRAHAEYPNHFVKEGVNGIPLVVCAGDRNIRRALYSLPSIQILEKYLVKS